jgi:hypothetical protein
VLEATTWYYYNNSGNVTRVVTNEEGTNNYVAHRMDYFTNGQAVEYVMGETWTWDGNPEHAPTAYDVTYARQFRYGERSERERAAIGKAGRDARVRPATCPQRDRTMRSTGGGARQRYLNRELNPDEDLDEDGNYDEIETQ